MVISVGPWTGTTHAWDHVHVSGACRNGDAYRLMVAQQAGVSGIKVILVSARVRHWFYSIVTAKHILPDAS